MYLRPHPEELAKQASRRMDAKRGLAAILRDARKGALLRMRSGTYSQPRSPGRSEGTIRPRWRCSGPSEVAMQTFVGMILGMLLLVAGVYIYDSMSTSTVAKGQVAQANRTIVNWDVAASDWDLLKRRAHDDWIKLSSK